MTEAIVEQVRRFTATVSRGGSGVVWSDGLVVTNAHVARGKAVDVRFVDGGRARGEIIASDPRRDLAALRVDTGGRPAAIVGDSDALRAGEIVVAVGNPLGVTGAAALGIVHSASSSDWVRADINLAPGNSGGPLVNARGEVIGINAMISSGLGLAVPSKAVERFLSASTRPRLGVTLQPVEIGLLVLDVTPGSIAARLGIGLGDVLVTGLNKLAGAMSGGVFSLDYQRAGVTRQITIDPREARRAA